MKGIFKASAVTDTVHWVGAIDWAVRDFHGYLTSRGTTYNAYLIRAEKTTLIDTVKSSFTDEMLARIGSLIDLTDIDYIVSNHAEPDHSGGLPRIIEATKPEKVFASKMGVKALKSYFHLDNLTEVADGEVLSLGDRSLTFVETSMCHWPDSMVSYLNEEQLLFSQDAFGMHLAGYERFADELPDAILDEEAAKYYANILLPLSSSVTKTLARITELGIELRIIAPDHGPIWRTDPLRIVEAYAKFARQDRNDKAVVVYDTMWGSTDRMARAVGEGLTAAGARAKLMSMSSCHRSDVATEIIDAGALVVGAPTINNQMFPTMTDVMGYLKGLRPKGLLGATFGSFGWSGEATKQLQAVLEEMKVEVVNEPLRVTYAPELDDLTRCYELGMKIARRLKEKTA